MGYADPKFSRNQFWFAVGAFVLAIVMLVAVTCRGEAQSTPTQTCTFTRAERDSTRRTVTATTVIWDWLSRDSVRAVCTKGPVRVDTVYVPAPAPTPTPPPVPPADTMGTLLWSEDFETSRGDWDDDGALATATQVTPTFGAAQGTKALQVTLASGQQGQWLSKIIRPGISGPVRYSFAYRSDRAIGTLRVAKINGGPEANPGAAFGNAGTCPTGSNLYSATYEFVGGVLGFYSQYIGMPGGPAACYGVSSGPGSRYIGSRTLAANTWHRLTFEVTPNDPGQANGSQRFWINGVLAGEWTGLRWRETDSLRNNAFTLDQHGSGPITVWYDDVQVRSLAVAPAPTPPPPDTTPAPPPSGGFAPPDLVNLNFNNAADDVRIENGGATFPGAYHTADATGGRNGSRAIRIQISPQFDNGFEPVGPAWPNRGRVFVRWYFRMQGQPGGNVKGFRFHSDYSNNGEFYGGSPCWAFDFEPSGWQGACFSTGVYYGAAPSNDLGFGIQPTCPNVADGNWHWLEVDYDRNAGSNVEVRIWCDGQAVVLPVGAAWFGAWNQTVPGVQWIGGDRATNTPTTWRTPRIDRNFLTGVYIWPTISQASGTATVWVDDVAASSQRIGP